MKRLLDHDPLTGITQTFESTDDGFQVHYEQDVTPILEDNRRSFNEGKFGLQSAKSEFRHVAEIPIMVQFKWLTEMGVDVHNRDHWPKVRKLLNDPDYRYLKTADVII